ncbi:MAG: 23S rRNA (adenine(2503)-C(2))-methyltransferase RlmN [Clostridia bacterium]|nr:23S rRNA (adenine(2503)-C(2))-methyltransferase RlmN [Clostridia bacterium]
MKEILQDLTYDELNALMSSLGAERFRAQQVAQGLAKGKKITDINIPKALKEKLLERYEDEPVRILETYTGADGTEKYLFRLADGNIVEGVLMKYKYGNTQCVSTQVGCRMGCRFCASTLHGLTRNLTAGEILSQVLVINALHTDGKARGVTNIVLMGSGEPLDNYDSTIRFIRNVSCATSLNISPRNISLSTCGLVPQMYRLADEGLPVNLTVSLHATTDAERARTMPIANKYTIREILGACSNYFNKTGRRYIFEYSLIDGENSEPEDAKALIQLLKGRPCHVNLIRLNEVKERSLRSATERKAQAFLKLLTEGGISATIRRQIGADIGGACGQLRASYLHTVDEGPEE